MPAKELLLPGKSMRSKNNYRYGIRVTAGSYAPLKKVTSNTVTLKSN
jgi:hypothetical protein